MIIRRLFFLVVALFFVHAVLFLGRRAALHALDDTYGFVGVDEQGRVRHWHDEFGVYSRILSADEVERVGIREGQVETIVRLTAGFPLKDRRAERDSRVEDQTADARAYMAFPYGDSDVQLAITLRGKSVKLHVSDRVLRREDLSGQRIYGLDNTRVFPVAGEFSHIDMQVPNTRDGLFVCVLNNEYWILNRRGEFVQRQPLGHDVSLAQFSMVGRSAAFGYPRGFLLPGGSFRPDRVPMRLVVARAGHDVIDRTIVFEPVTEEQRWIAATFGAMAAVRPVPLLVAAMASEEPSCARELFDEYWIDSYLAQGANSGWFVAALAITLICAWCAFRWGRVRLASLPDRGFWIVAVLLLGPSGLLWMRLSIPWVAVENGCAVNIESHGWSEPTRNGTEVFGSAAPNPVHAAPLAVE